MSDANTSIVMTVNAETAPSMSGQRTLPAYCQTCRLLTLPAELRLHIYRLVLVQGPLGRLNTLQHYSLRWPFVDVHQYKTKNTALLATCQKIYDEGIETFYSNNTFMFPALVQDFAGCIQPKPTCSLMRHVDLRTGIWMGLAEGEKEALAAAEACVRVIMGSCPAISLIKVYVYYHFAKEVKGKWEFLDVSPNLVWYSFQAFPMRNTQRTALVAMNSKRMVEVLKVWDLSAFAKNAAVQQRRCFLERL